MNSFNLNLNLSSTPSEDAQQMWKALDHLFESDPEKYHEFIQNQMKEMKKAQKKKPTQGKESPKEEEESFKQEKQDHIHHLPSSSKIPSCLRSSNPSLSYIIPKKAFVIQTCMRVKKIITDISEKNEDKRRLLHVNICHHEAIHCPLNQNNELIDITNVNAEATQIPFIFSKLRSSSEDFAIDAIAHPWCIRKSQVDLGFQRQLVYLILDSIDSDGDLQKAFKLISPREYKSLKDIDYVPCTTPTHPEGDQILDVHPYYIDEKSIQEQKERRKKQSEQSSKQVDDTDTTIMNSPQTLLKNITQVQQESTSEEQKSSHTDTGDFLSLETHCDRKPPLIQDITDGETGVPSSQKYKKITETKEKTNAKRKKKKEKTIKKGFLLSSGKSKLLYNENGSSGDGLTNGLGGSYAKLMSKCQVVDMRTDNAETASRKSKRDEKVTTHQPHLREGNTDTAENVNDFLSQLSDLARIVSPTNLTG